MTAVLARPGSLGSVCTNSLVDSLRTMCWKTGDMQMRYITTEVDGEARITGGSYIPYSGMTLTRKNALDIAEQLRRFSDVITDKTVSFQGLKKEEKAARMRELFNGVLTEQMVMRLVDTFRPDVTEVTVLRAARDTHFSLFVDFC